MVGMKKGDEEGRNGYREQNRMLLTSRLGRIVLLPARTAATAAIITMVG